jgi:hypothetical protein
MSNSIIIENYLNMLSGEDNILFYHVFVNTQNNNAMIATITAIDRNKYHITVEVDDKKVIDGTYPTLKSAFRILHNLQA